MGWKMFAFIDLAFDKNKIVQSTFIHKANTHIKNLIYLCLNKASSATFAVNKYNPIKLKQVWT